MPHDVNAAIIAEFRAHHGRVGGSFEGARLLLLTTTGARTGQPHTTPVGYLPDGDRVLVIASAGGAPRHPAWFHNLVAHPRVTVEDGTFTYEANAVVLHDAERDHLFARATEAHPGWADYQAKTTRVLPVVALEGIPGPPRPNATSFGEALRAIHNAFRHELAVIRAEIADSGPRLGAQLRVNCLTLCQGLHHHHTIEDSGMFPALAEQHPELRSTVDRLGREHESIARLLTELHQVITDETTSPTVVLGEVDRLTDELEAHLTYEEEQLIPILEPATT